MLVLEPSPTAGDVGSLNSLLPSKDWLRSVESIFSIRFLFADPLIDLKLWLSLSGISSSLKSPSSFLVYFLRTLLQKTRSNSKNLNHTQCERFWNFFWSYLIIVLFIFRYWKNHHRSEIIRIWIWSQIGQKWFVWGDWFQGFEWFQWFSNTWCTVWMFFFRIRFRQIRRHRIVMCWRASFSFGYHGIATRIIVERMTIQVYGRATCLFCWFHSGHFWAKEFWNRNIDTLNQDYLSSRLVSLKTYFHFP